MKLHLSPRDAGPRARKKFTIRRLKPSSLQWELSIALVALALVSILPTACAVDERQSGIPDGAQATINLVTEDFAAGRYEKIYREAADEWRARATVEQSNETFRTLKDKLGAVKERTYLSGRQQQQPTAGLPQGSLIIRYNTNFERAEGMETFTLIERDGRYQLAGYSVSSNVLKQ